MKAPHVLVSVFFAASVVPAAVAQSVMRQVDYPGDGYISEGFMVERIGNESIAARTHAWTIRELRMGEIQEFGDEEFQSSSTTSARSKKSPLLAGFLSLVLPGAGQIYNGDTFLGIVHAGLYGGGIATALTLGFRTEYQRTGTRLVSRYSYTSRRTEYYYEPDYGYVDVETDYLYIGLGVAGLTLIWSVVDAIVTAVDDGDQIGQTSAPRIRLAILPLPQEFRARFQVTM